MSALLGCVSFLAFLAFRILMAFLSFVMPRSPLVAYFDREVLAPRRKLEAINKEEARALSMLNTSDQMLYFSFNRFPAVKAATRKFWDAACPSVYVELYRTLGYTAEEAEEAMLKQLKAPPDFRKKVQELLRA